MYSILIDALQFGCFHWDVRLSNIVFNDEINDFSVIDWEFSCFFSKRNGYFTTEKLAAANAPFSYSLLSSLDTIKVLVFALTRKSCSKHFEGRAVRLMCNTNKTYFEQIYNLYYIFSIGFNISNTIEML